VKRIASILSIICLGWVTLALPIQGAMGAVPGVTEEGEDLRVILDAFAGESIWIPAVKSQVDAELQDLMTRDLKVDRLLKANPSLKAALIERATPHYQSILRNRLPALRAQLGRRFNEGMTAAQRKAPANMLSSETGKRIFAYAFVKMFSETDGLVESEELSDAQAADMIDKKDVSVMLAFSQSGANRKFEKIMDDFGGPNADDFEPLMDDSDEFFLSTLSEIEHSSRYSI
jgi:hypothetical protein